MSTDVVASSWRRCPARASATPTSARGGIGEEALIRRILDGNAAMQHGSDVEAIEDVNQPGDVILVRVRQDEQVDATREEGEVGAQPPEGELRVRPTVDQHRGAARSLDEDRVALADVEHGQVQTSVRA